MIDPACGSGHFLLGAFPRILGRWQKQEPGAKVRDLVQRALHSVHGVDVNPYAIAIARFRLWLAALNACGITKLKDAPALELNLACGDSLWHAPLRGSGKVAKGQREFNEFSPEADVEGQAHTYFAEDAQKLSRFLRESHYHCVVANPPYITPKDKALNQDYRNRYESCHMKYSLAVPFMERIFRLAIRATDGAGHTGQITSNSFYEASVGKKLIEQYFPRVDLSHVIDASGAYIPGHGTPTVILFGRNREPVGSLIRTVMGIMGEPGSPEVPSKGLVWTAILSQLDSPGSIGQFVSVDDSERSLFHSHPWSIGGGGAAELKEFLDESAVAILKNVSDSVGVIAIAGAEEVFFDHSVAGLARSQVSHVRPFVTGEDVRDWVTHSFATCFFPYGENGEAANLDDNEHMFLWPYRRVLETGLYFGKSKADRNMHWYEYAIVMKDRVVSRSAQFSDVSTHNHFVEKHPSTICDQHSPLVTFPTDIPAQDFYRVLSFLNSSTTCFWLKQCAHNKGDSTDSRGARTTGDVAFNTYEFNSTLVSSLPLPAYEGECTGELIQGLAKKWEALSPAYVLKDANASDEVSVILKKRQQSHAEALSTLTLLQEDSDWRIYMLFGLITEELTYPKFCGHDVDEQLNCTAFSQPGQRAFEIVLARRIALGEVQTAWFERHGSTPITKLPDHWPADYKKLVQRRIEVIESNPQVALIEQPEYKRRWNTEPWDSQVERALKSWLLDRLESYLDFDGRMNDDGKPTAKIDISLTSVAKLADVARQDEQFMEVAEVYRDDPAFDVQRLVAELVQSEHVPLLPVLRYKPNGLRNRAEWEKTWELQRLEDKLRAGDAVILDDYELTAQQREEIAKWQTDAPDAQRADDRGLDAILSIPVPPKYKSSDFISSGGARYWSLRGKLDVPKERWVSFPHCEGPDGTLMIAWAGYNHLQLAQAISTYYVDVQERLGGRDDPRLIPLLAGVIELLPWLKQWHHEIDPEYNQRMDEVYEGFVTEEAKGLSLTIEEIKAWEPPAKTSSKKRRAKS